MRDEHIHIGKFKDTYYEPLEVIQTVMEAGIEGLSFSSTTSCRDNVLYTEVENEIKKLLSQLSWNTDIIKPYLWYIPDYIYQKINIEWFFDNIPYQGIKLHPFAHNWDFDNKKHFEVLHELLNYAEQKHLPVLIHTGHSGVDSADKFEQFFRDYRHITFVLAHCRPLEKTIEMMAKYSNVYGDTAFVPDEDIEEIIQAGYKSRIIFGTDFPITHYFKTKYPKPGENAFVTLEEQYAIDSHSFGEVINEINRSES